MSKKIIVVPGNTDLNRGDQALIWESSRLIKDIYKEKVEILLIESGGSDGDVDKQIGQTKKLGYHFLKPILKHPNRFFKMSRNIQYGKVEYILWGVIALLDLLTSLLLLCRLNWVNKIGYLFYSKQDRKTIDTFKEVDAVYIKGGGFMHSYGKVSDPYLTYYSLFLPLLALKYKKPLYILPNSIGPLKHPISRRIVYKVLSGSSFVAVRENISKKYVENFLLLSCFQYPDLGYFLQKSDFNANIYMKKCNIPDCVQKVGITLRPYRFPESLNPTQKYEEYINSIIQFIYYLNNKNYYVVFCAHTLGPSAHENDWIAINDVMKRLPKEINYSCIRDESLSCKDMMMLYSTFQYFVGTRFHSVIFSQNVNVPTIAISYGGNKGDGIMSDLGLNDYVIPINSVKEDILIAAFNKLVNGSDKYREKLSENYQICTKRRCELIEQIQKI